MLTCRNSKCETQHSLGLKELKNEESNKKENSQKESDNQNKPKAKTPLVTLAFQALFILFRFGLWLDAALVFLHATRYQQHHP